jgi:hypothetical protein
MDSSRGNWAGQCDMSGQDIGLPTGANLIALPPVGRLPGGFLLEMVQNPDRSLAVILWRTRARNEGAVFPVKHLSDWPRVIKAARKAAVGADHHGAT